MPFNLYFVGWLQVYDLKQPWHHALVKSPLSINVELTAGIFLRYFIISQKATGDALLEKVSAEISQISQENTCARVSFLIKLQLYQKRDSGAGIFL